MDRLLALYRVGSSGGAVVALVGANLVPLAGVLFFGWDLQTILVVYWLENGIVGAYNVLKMALARGPVTVGATGLTIGEGTVSVVAKAAVIPFFLVHYGMFWVVHGVFVVALSGFGDIVGGVAGPEGPRGEVGLPGAVPGGFLALPPVGTLAWAVIGLAVSHGVSFYLNYIRRGEYLRSSAPGLMGAPYARVVVLHLTIIFGAILVMATGAPIMALVVLVALKIALDLGLHLREHRRAAASPATPA